MASIRYRGIFLAMAQGDPDANQPCQSQCRPMEKYALVQFPLFHRVGGHGGRRDTNLAHHNAEQERQYALMHAQGNRVGEGSDGHTLVQLVVATQLMPCVSGHGDIQRDEMAKQFRQTSRHTGLVVFLNGVPQIVLQRIGRSSAEPEWG